jgi:hypothetical protein
VPKFAGETSSATEAKEPSLLPEIKKLAKVPSAEKLEKTGTEEAKSSKIKSFSRNRGSRKPEGANSDPKKKKNG